MSDAKGFYLDISTFLKKIKSGDELRSLQNLRKLLNARSNAAAETIKDIVFEHYKHFIETSKEISNLEREIYQLSSLLSEQKGLIENLMEMSGQEKKSTGSATTYSATSNFQNQLHSLMHKMDGVAAIINTLKDNDRILLQSQMMLLNSTNMEPEHPILLILLTNSLLIGYPTDNNGKYPFQLMVNHSLEEIAIVNFKSHARTGDDIATSNEHVLQLLIFPEQIYVRCESAREKREWLDTVEQVKRQQEQEKSLIRQATIRARRRSTMVLNNPPDMKTSRLSDSGRRVGRKDAIERIEKVSNEAETPSILSDTQWLNDLIDELHVIISDRHMDQAVELLLEWKDCGCKDAAINAKFIAIERQVVKILSDDVRRPGSRHRSGSHIAFSKPLSLLTSLGRGIYAIDLYLRRRGSFLRFSTNELVSEEPLSYVRQISTLFVNEVLDVANKFCTQRQHFCLILQWASGELSIVLSMIRRNVIEVAPTISVLAHTWRILMNNCDQLAPIGMDLSFEISRLLTPALTHALQKTFNNVIESIVIRISEEKWNVYNLENESNLNRFLEEMADFGLPIDWAICGNDVPQSRFAINISQSACQFSRLAFSLSRDFALLDSARLDCLTDSFLQMLWCEYLLHLATASASLVQETTARFIVSQLNPRGVIYSFTLVVSFHPIFLTGVDKAFNIKCFFLEAVKAIDIALDVSPLTTVVIEREFALPQCVYHLKQRSDGPFLKFANIGEPITHVWQCDPVAGWIYGVLIHSCYVDDGRGNRFDLIDERGCAIDRYLLDDLVYDEKGLGAFVNTHVFRYADRIQLFFTCTLQLCFKDDGGCKGITPPSCRSKDSSFLKGTLSHEELNHKPTDLPVPPGIPTPRGVLHKFRNRPFRPALFGERRSSPPLGSPYKDSPLSNGTENELDLLEALINDTESDNGTVRTSRNAAANSRMETDLSVDLTVLPLHESSSSNESDAATNDRSENSTTESLNESQSTISDSSDLKQVAAPQIARLLSEQNQQECYRWSRIYIFICTLLLIFIVAIITAITTLLTYTRIRKHQLTHNLGCCGRVMQGIWRD